VRRDLDGDGLGEVAAGFDWSDLIVYEATPPGPLLRPVRTSPRWGGRRDGNGDAGGILYAAGTSDSGYGDGLYFVTTRRRRRSSTRAGAHRLDWTGLWRIRTADVDDDPQREIFFTTSRLYTGS